MKRSSFNSDWTVQSKSNPFAELMGEVDASEGCQAVTLPHDWLIKRDRSPLHAPGAPTGYYPDGGVVVYEKTFSAPDGYRDGRVDIEFDGVFRDAMIHVNNSFVGQRPSGYTPFSVRVDKHLIDGDNLIRVECRKQLDSRWYTGVGIYRDTWLAVGGPVHIAPRGMRIQTLSADAGSAVIEVVSTVENETVRFESLRIATELLDGSGRVVASDVALVSTRPAEAALVRQRLFVPQPQRWGPDSPTLYTCRTTLLAREQDDELDAVSTLFGIRTLEWDSVRGLRLNGETIKLRGGAVHHDNGILGAATIARAEERRVELLKRAGFNAIRSAHNPISTAMLEACDRLGMLVMDEAFDTWRFAKADFDYTSNLPRWWRSDLTAMIERDINHPSVILYSIGNEIPDTGNSWDAALGRDMVDLVKKLDPTRPVTNAINATLSANHERPLDLPRPIDPSVGINTLMNEMLAHVQGLLASDVVTERIDEALSQLDVAGYNYAPVRYAVDIENHPQRLILGTETTTRALSDVWWRVEHYPQVIGDFGWTAWDYIGEAGIARSNNATAGGALFADYPYRVSMTGETDITGRRRTASYWREVVWGLRTEPFIAVHRPQSYPTSGKGGLWSWSDSLASWTWPGFEGVITGVEIYSDADEVELLLDGGSLGRRPAGRDHDYIAAFELEYRPGELTAIAYVGGIETGRSSLLTAGPDVLLRAVADRVEVRADDTDLVFVDISLSDTRGVTQVLAARHVTVEVTGAGMLQGLGSGDPASENNYTDTSCDVFDGHALAVVRPTAVGEILIRVSTELGEQTELRVAAGLASESTLTFLSKES